MSKFINPFTDIGFKRIFGQEVSKPILIGFLNALFEGEHHITDLKLLNNEQLGESAANKSLIYDVYCKTDSGERIIVEMQYKSQPWFKERSIYYLSRAFSRQGEPGKQWNYDQLKAVYIVSLLNFRTDVISQDFRCDVGLMDLRRMTPFSDKMRLVYLQMPRFAKDVEQCETLFEKFIYVLKNMDVLNRLPWLAQEAVFQKLASVADVASLTQKERMEYDENLRIYRDTVAVMEGQYLEGRAKGRAEGEAKGRAEGRAEGKAETALKMKAMGLSNDIIMQATDLTAEEIEQL